MRFNPYSWDLFYQKREQKIKVAFSCHAGKFGYFCPQGAKIPKFASMTE
jgi:hypothetical protein